MRAGLEPQGAVCGQRSRRGARLAFVMGLALQGIFTAGIWATPPSYTFTTLAGRSQVGGFADSTGRAARFDHPAAIASDGAGNYYVADRGNNLIRKVTPVGAVTTFAGTMGVAGSLDGTGTAAQFNQPNRLVIDGAGNLYVGSAGDGTLRRITTGGVVTTLTAAGYTSNPGSGVVSVSGSIAADAAGNIYVPANNVITRFAPDGTTSVLAGQLNTPGYNDATGAAARFNQLDAICADEAGNLYVSTTTNDVTPTHVIRRITTAGVVTTFTTAGFAANPASGFPKLFGALSVSLAIDYLGDFYFADFNASTLYEFTAAGAVVQLDNVNNIVAGLTDGPIGTSAFWGPTGIVPDASHRLAVIDSQSGALRLISALIISGDPVASPPDPTNRTVSTLAGFPTDSAGSADGTGTANGTARFYHPIDLAVDAAGNVYVADAGNNTVRKIAAADGSVTTVAGSPGVAASVDGIGAAANFDSLGGITVDPNGNVYVTETVWHHDPDPDLEFVTGATVRKISFDSEGVATVTTLAGDVSSTSSAINDSATYFGTQATFFFPSGIAADRAGNLYVADTFHNRIRKITPGGAVTTRVNTLTLSSVIFRQPYGVAVDQIGNIYATCLVNDFSPKIAKFTAAGTYVTSGLGANILPPGFNLDGQVGGVAVDSVGDVFVANEFRNTVTAYSPAGTFSQQLGDNSMSGPTGFDTGLTSAGTIGSRDGDSSIAQFYSPYGVAVDAHGNVYVADLPNNTIRKGTVSGSTPAITSGPQSQTIHAGQNVTFTVVATGTAPLSYQWLFNGGPLNNGFLTPPTLVLGATTDSLTINSADTSTAGNYSVQVTNLIGNVTSSAAVLTVTPFAAPQVTTPPQSQTVAAGGSVTFTVVATGTPAPAYQWKKGGANVVNATADSLTLANIQPGDAGDYTVVVTNDAGTITSAVATLTVNFAPTITAQPQSLNLFVGDNPVISVTAAGSPAPAYQWRKNGAPISGATSSSLSLSNVQLADAADYTVVVTNTINAVTSNNATLAIVAPVAVQITAQPQSQGAAVGDTVTFSVTATGTPVPTYQWAKDGTDLPGATSATLTLTNVQVADAGSYTVVASNNLSTAYSSTLDDIRSATSNSAVLTVAAAEPITVVTLVGSGAGFGSPNGIAVDSRGNVFVSDYSNQIIYKITPDGVVAPFAGSVGQTGSADGTGSAARFNFPYGLAIDSADNVYVTDAINHTIRKITPAGVVTTLAGAAGQDGTTDGTGSAARFSVLFTQLAVDSSGNVFVGEPINYTIRKITPAGVVTTLAGAPGLPGTDDGTGAAARFEHPAGIAVDNSGNVFVADAFGSTIRKITAGGVVTTYAGSAFQPGSTDGPRATALLGAAALAADSAGNLYLVDNQTVREITAGGIVTTLAGSPGHGGNLDGIGSDVRFNNPGGVAIDSAGFFYVADLLNGAIRKGGIAATATILVQPQSQSVSSGAAVTFKVVADALPLPAYQWNKNGAPIDGATSANYTIASAQSGDAASYTVTVANNKGSVTSHAAALTLGTAFTAFQNLNFTGPELTDAAISGLTADPDHDDIGNLLEYAFALDPRHASRTGLPVAGLTAVSGQNYLTISYTRLKSASDLTYAVEVSDDLSSWTSGTTLAVSTTDLGDTETVVVRDPVATTDASRRFLRVTVTGPSSTSATTAPVGFVGLPALANSDTLMSLPLSRASVYVDTVANVSGNVLTVSGAPAWAANQFVKNLPGQPDTYYVAFNSGAKAGQYYSVTGNSAATITLDLANDTLSGVQAGDSIRVIPYWTFGTVFPGGLGVTGNNAHGTRLTEILLYDRSAIGTNQSPAFTYYYFTGTNPGWRRVGGGLSTVRDSDPIPPDSYFVFRQNTANAQRPVLRGAVAMDPIGTVVRTLQSGTAQDNFLAYGVPVPLTLAQLNLFQSGAFEGSSSHGSRLDELYIYNNAVAATNKSPSAVYYYFTGTNPGWRRVGGGLSTVRDNDFVLQPGDGFVVRKSAKPSPQASAVNYFPAY